MTAATNRHGFAIGPAGVEATALPALVIASLSAFKGRGADLAALLNARYGLSLPDGPVYRAAGPVGAVGLGPNRWLIVAEAAASGFVRELAAACTGLAAVAEQSDAFIGYRLTGPDVRRTCAKGVPIDLHPDAFPVGAAATTVAAHIGLTLWRPDDDSFILLVARSYQGSFVHWLSESAAEFGMTLNDIAERG